MRSRLCRKQMLPFRLQKRLKRQLSMTRHQSIPAYFDLKRRYKQNFIKSVFIKYFRDQNGKIFSHSTDNFLLIFVICHQKVLSTINLHKIYFCCSMACGSELRKFRF